MRKWLIGLLLILGFASSSFAQSMGGGSYTWGIGSGTLIMPNTGFAIYDTGGDHYLTIVPGTNLTANRQLTITTGDAARVITLSGDPTLNDWFDQAVKAASSPTFASVTDSALTATRVVFAGASKELADDGDLTFATDTLTATKIIAPTSATIGAVGSQDRIIVQGVAKGAGQFDGTLSTIDLTGARAWNLPNEDGTICTTGSICTGYAASTSDVTSAGDCASGACYDGTSDGGTYVYLYDGATYTKLTATTRALTLASSATDSENLIVTLGNNDNTVALSSGTGANSITASGITFSPGTLTPTNPVGAAYGGTGVANNASSTLTISGSFATTLTVTNTTALTLPTSGTLATNTQTIVNGATGLTLSAAQVSNTVISNTGQGPNDVNHALPASAAGYSFRAIVGETQGAKYWRFTRNGSDVVCLDGTCAKTYVQIAAPTQGATLQCDTLQSALTGINASAALAIGTTKTNVASGAFTFDIVGTGYSKAAVAAGTAPANDVIPQSKFGGVGFEIGVDGTIHAMEAADNVTGYDSAALALAAAQAVALTDANHTRIGYVTASKSDGTFTFGTTELDAANTTVAYTSNAAYTKPYYWICSAIKGTWATD